MLLSFSSIDTVFRGAHKALPQVRISDVAGC
jgi:hypothetical protein